VKNCKKSTFSVTLQRLQGWFCEVNSNEQGQDLVEYALLTGFMVVAVWAVIPSEIVPSISGIFSRLLSTASVLVP
jgi:Flp pilus assembly pilin Flp